MILYGTIALWYLWKCKKSAIIALFNDTTQHSTVGKPRFQEEIPQN